MLPGVLSEALALEAADDVLNAVLEDEGKDEDQKEDGSDGKVENGMGRVEEPFLEPLAKVNLVDVLIEPIDYLKVSCII